MFVIFSTLPDKMSGGTKFGSDMSDEALIRYAVAIIKTLSRSGGTGGFRGAVLKNNLKNKLKQASLFLTYFITLVKSKVNL